MLKRMWLKLPLVIWGVKKEKVAISKLTSFAQSILVGSKIKFSNGPGYLKKVN